MVFLMAGLKIAGHWLLSCYRAAKKLRSYGFLHRNNNSNSNNQNRAHPPSLTFDVTKCSLEGRANQTMVCDFFESLLRCNSLFPYYMLVAFEGGSLIRALLLLLCSPFLCLFGWHEELSLKIMVFITFCGLRTKDMDLVARAVLPKFYLEDLHLHAYEVLVACAKRRVVFSSAPKVMVDGFLKEYLSVGEVVGPELQVVRGCYFTGFFCSPDAVVLKQSVLKDLFGEDKADVGLVGSRHPQDHHLFIYHCKETYLVNKEDIITSNSKNAVSASPVMPRDKYPKPLIFHDGRLAFLPTPLATFFLYMWLPLAFPLAVLRVLLGVILPYKASIIIGSFTGVRLRVINLPCKHTTTTSTDGVLYVCTHRTLLDPVMLSTALARPVPAVTYSLSRLSELIAPMRTVRLTRDRHRDAETMKTLLREGDLVVCPEGTTCREPYLLRFSSLFAELADEIVPVAVDVRVSMFYGTTASGLKWLDPIFFLMNPRPEYSLEFLEKVPPEMTCSGGWSAAEVANGIQRKLAGVLEFESTGLTRRDKYLMLAGNEGVVVQHQNKKI